MTHQSLYDALPPPRLGPSEDRLSARSRELLNALESMILREGFEHLTVGEITSRLHCSRSTLYEIAPSKDELILVVVDRRLRRIGREKQARLAELTEPAEKLELVITSKSLELQETSIRFMEDVARAPAVQRVIADHFRFGVAQLRGIIEEGITSGRFAPVPSLLTAEVIDASLARLQRPGILGEVGLTYDEATLELTRLLMGGLVQTSTRARPRARTSVRDVATER